MKHIVCSFLLLLTVNLYAQKVIKPVVSNFSELANGTQVPLSPNPIIDGRGKNDPDKKLPFNLPIPDGVKVSTLNSTNQNETLQRTNSASPIWSVDFNALSDVRDRQTSSLIPPDTHGAVGIDRIVTVTNGEVRILRKNNGGQVGSVVTLNTFWQPLVSQLGYSLSTFDPKVLFDPFQQRFIITTCANSSSANSSLLIAVSQGADPTAGWYYYGLDVDASNTFWFDYPSIGFNKNWIVISGNMFPVTSGTQRADIYVFNKLDMYNGSPLTFATNYQQLIMPNSAGFTFAPAIDYDHVSNEMFLVQSWNSSSGTIKLSRLSGTLPFVDRFDVGFLNSPNGGWANQGNSTFNFAPQLGSFRFINTNDGRMQNAVLVNNKLWSTHTIHLPASSPTRSSIQWWCLNTSGNLLQTGRIDDQNSLQPNFRAFPSICANKNDEVLIGYTVFNESFFPSAAYSYRNATDVSGTMRDEQIYKTGLDAYVKTFSTDVNARNRWGDYSNTMLDQADQSFWTIQQFADLRNTSTDNNNFGRWNTWWARVPAQTSGLTPLPVHLVSINGKVVNNSYVNLTWETSTEVNTKEFVILKSNNGGLTFTTVGTVKAKGTDNKGSVYSFNDENPFFGNSYYRLKMIDKDGSTQFSRSIPITIQQKNLVISQVYPNPAKDFVYVSIYLPLEDKLSFQITDISGKNISNYTSNFGKGYTTVELPLKNVASGNYQITILSTKHEQKSVRFIK
ncbi:MAG: T9SS type A sorting domain-containing protein [Chitinophagaceae bacterium]|jgi:hypothetical protein|nr:T9SS type A sorting domain-containing protein [Chitinophagaceae bacterium]